MEDRHVWDGPIVLPVGVRVDQLSPSNRVERSATLPLWSTATE